MPEQEDLSDPAVFDGLYRAQGSPVRRFLQVWLGDKAAADDVLQETFLHFWRRPSGFDRVKGNIRAYLLGIARKKAADWRRRNKSVAADAVAVVRESHALLIQDALSHLPEDLRSTLWLREVEGYSYEELARILNVPVGTVRSRLHAARQKLRTIWNQEAQ